MKLVIGREKLAKKTPSKSLSQYGVAKDALRKIIRTTGFQL